MIRKRGNMKKHRESVFFLALISICLILAFYPYPTTLKFFSPIIKGAKTQDAVQSVTGNFHDEIRQGKTGSIAGKVVTAEIVLPARIEEDDYLTVEASGSHIGVYSYMGMQFLKAINNKNMLAYREETYAYDMTFAEMTFTEAVLHYASEDDLLIFSVKGSSKAGFNQEMADVMHRLGFETTPDMLEDADSYAAYAYQGNVESESGDQEASLYHVVNGHRIYVGSAGVFAGNESRVLIDGQDVSANGNGINLVVYDPIEGKLIDSICYHTNTEHVVSERRQDLFAGKYVFRINARLLKQLKMYSSVARNIYCVLYLMLACAIALLWWDVRRTKKNMEQKKRPSTVSIVLESMVVILFLAASILLHVGYFYLKDHFKQVSISQLVFHMNTNLDGTNWSDFSALFTKLAFAGVGMLAALAIIIVVTRKITEDPAHPHFPHIELGLFVSRWVIVIASIIWTSIIIDAFWWNYDGYGYLVSQQSDAEIFENEYADPDEVAITFPEQKKNLIYIFMESMETTAADEMSGGGKIVNLIPELTEIAKQNDQFNGDAETLNGAIPLNNCTWTIAGIVAQTTGLPLEIDHGMSNLRGTVTQFMPGATALGDILEREGYQQVFMLGSDAKFGNRAQYFTEHGNYEVKDYYYAKTNKMIPQNYFEWWGYEDAKLFAFAKEEAQRLASEEKPFNLTLLTVDTHFTNGYLCEECPDTYQDQYSNVISCSSKQISEFVKWVNEQPWGKDTVIVLAGDHLCMDSQYYEDIPDNYERNTFVTVINSAKKETKENRKYATIDLFPTTLSALGAQIEGDRLGLGTDLYSDTETLLEEYGEGYLNEEFMMNSRFYQNQILLYD